MNKLLGALIFIIWSTILWATIWAPEGELHNQLVSISMILLLAYNIVDRIVRNTGNRFDQYDGGSYEEQRKKKDE